MAITPVTSLKTQAQNLFHKLWQLPIRQTILLMLAMYPAALLYGAIFLGLFIIIPSPTQEFETLYCFLSILFCVALISFPVGAILLNIKLLFIDKKYMKILWGIILILQFIVFKFLIQGIAMMVLVIFWTADGSTILD